MDLLKFSYFSSTNSTIVQSLPLVIYLPLVFYLFYLYYQIRHQNRHFQLHGHNINMKKSINAGDGNDTSSTPNDANIQSQHNKNIKQENDKDLDEENKKLKDRIVQLRIEIMALYREKGDEIDALQHKMILMHRKNNAEIAELVTELTIKKMEVAKLKKQVEKLKKHLSNLIKSKNADDEHDN